ncbi:hypothetical protein [uncultured Streptomyces sp.]|uniref:DUF7144 family membrane protein n=1 Tax=uncultured Streptomyces sp. TaxID=174707 RepID=UPI002636CF4F|nr:hypothetical protein [uncultured Streptomyces sp.]
MSQSTSAPRGAGGTSSGTPGHGGKGGHWAAGGTMFAGVLLLVDGVLDIIKGIAGLADNDVYAQINNYVFKFDLTSWGWIHIVLGVILALVGWSILKGAAWARGAGVAIAGLNMIANFLWLPYAPVMAIISIAIDAFVIWALCTDRSGSVI